MSGYALLKAVIVPSASVAWAQLYQMTSPSFFAAGTIFFFHSPIADWNFPGSGAAGVVGRRRLPLWPSGLRPTAASGIRRGAKGGGHRPLLVQPLLH